MNPKTQTTIDDRFRDALECWLAQQLEAIDAQYRDARGIIDDLHCDLLELWLARQRETIELFQIFGGSDQAVPVAGQYFN